MSRISRRNFVQTATLAITAGSLNLAAGPEQEPRIGFSTLGCPAWNWIKILDFARQNGFLGIELRGLQGSMDLPSRPEFAPHQIAQSKKEVADRGLRISCVSSSANMHDTDPQKHEQQLADARRFIDLASALGVPYVRVFGNSITGSREQAIQRVAASLREIGGYAGGRAVKVIMESHGDFVDSPTLRAVLEQANSPHVALLWDAHHTYVSGKEDPEFTVSQLGKYICHTHLKDSRRQGNDVHYVLTGQGEVPVKRQIQALSRIGYQGFYSFEWEKAWHPEIEDPEVAFPDFARVVTQYLREART